jgi:hypothetical protein
MDYRRILMLIACSALLHACSGGNGDQPAPAADSAAEAASVDPANPVVEEVIEVMPARVFIVSPENGAEVSSPLTVVFGIEGFEVAPAGTYDEGTGHHHLLVDTELPAMDQPIPADDNHLHFGKGQTETSLELEPGEHTLLLLLGDGNHVPHDSALISDPVTITVKAE